MHLRGASASRQGGSSRMLIVDGGGHGTVEIVWAMVL